MPKENTHLHFALEVAAQSDLSELQKHERCYLAGSVFPDIFYYTPGHACISRKLHGEIAFPTNEIILKLLRLLKQNRNERMLAFTLGYVTHSTLDILLHPLVNDWVDAHNPQDTKEEKYWHMLCETALDYQLFGDSMKVVEPMRDKEMMKFLGELMDVYPKVIRTAYKNNAASTRLFRNPFAFALSRYIPESIAYRGLFYTYENRKQPIGLEAFRQKYSHAHTVISRQFAIIKRYLSGEIEESKIDEAIPDISLELGSSDFGVESLSF